MIECTLEDLYEFNKIHNIKNNKFKVYTRHGLKSIEDIDITAKNSIQHEIKTNYGKSIISSPDHLFFNNNWKKAKLFKTGDSIETKDGIEIIESNNILNEYDDLYDIQVEDVKEFYANDFVSHNSTIANSVIYALYGKIEGLKLTDLPNRINKQLWVEIKLKCNNTQVHIERGLAPTLFNVKLNGIEFDKANKRSVQEYLEEEIYGIPYHVFKNIIILSVDDFKSFLTMKNHDKKQIIDRMFGFSILNEMQQLVKESRKNLKSDLSIYQSELNNISENIKQLNTKLEQLMQESDAKNKEEIQELKDALKKYDADKQKLQKAQSKIEDKLNLTKEDLNQSQNKEWELKNELKSLRKKLKLYEGHICPTCESELTTDFHLERKIELEKQEEQIPAQIKKITAEVKDLNKSIHELTSKDQQIRDRVSTLNTNINNFKTELTKIKKSLGNTDNFGHIQQLIQDFEDKENKKLTQYGDTNSEFFFLEQLEEILGEDGVKNLAIKTILPGLNANIAAMSQTMHLQFHIRFDEKFNCIVNHLGEEINPMTLSKGERKKADFIIIIAIIKILKLRFPQLNMLFLDELLSSVDADGIHNILKILSQVIKENGLNTFVINHTELPRELFDRQIQIYRENGFSKFSIEKIQ